MSRVLLEPPDAHTAARRPQASLTPLRLAAAIGAAVMAATSTGDALLFGVLLGVVAADVLIGAAGVLAGLAVLGRWGSTSLAALAGGQAVVGAAGWSGTTFHVASTWAAFAALVLGAPTGLPAAVAFGLGAANVVAGPAPGGAIAIRVVVSAIAVALAYGAAAWVPRSQARAAAGTVAVAAALLALAR